MAQRKSTGVRENARLVERAASAGSSGVYMTKSGLRSLKESVAAAGAQLAAGNPNFHEKVDSLMRKMSPRTSTPIPTK